MILYNYDVNHLILMIYFINQDLMKLLKPILLIIFIMVLDLIKVYDILLKNFITSRIHNLYILNNLNNLIQIKLNF